MTHLKSACEYELAGQSSAKHIFIRFSPDVGPLANQAVEICKYRVYVSAVACHLDTRVFFFLFKFPFTIFGLRWLHGTIVNALIKRLHSNWICCSSIKNFCCKCLWTRTYVVRGFHTYKPAMSKFGHAGRHVFVMCQFSHRNDDRLFLRRSS